MSKGVVVAAGLVLSGGLIVFVEEASSSPVSAEKQGKIEASIFAYDGKDFVRTKTTLVTKEGKPATNTKLEHDTPAYKALVQKHSYTGDATVFGRKYDANYAPLTSEDGRLTGALFVAVAK
ncbi:MAG: Cache 3/Cache 2 fusion domain-containing protein [Gemmatimonadales bacterium]